MDACLGEVNEPFTNTGLLKGLLKAMILMNIILTVSSYINNNITILQPVTKYMYIKDCTG